MNDNSDGNIDNTITKFDDVPSFEDKIVEGNEVSFEYKLVEDDDISAVYEIIEDDGSSVEDDEATKNEEEEEEEKEGGNKKTCKPKEKKVIVAVQLLNETITELSTKFNEQYPYLKMSRTSFWKNIPEYFTSKGKKRTDMCHICEYGKTAIKLLSQTKDEESKKQARIFLSSIIKNFVLKCRYFF